MSRSFRSLHLNYATVTRSKTYIFLTWQNGATSSLLQSPPILSALSDICILTARKWSILRFHPPLQPSRTMHSFAAPLKATWLFRVLSRALALIHFTFVHEWRKWNCPRACKASANMPSRTVISWGTWPCPRVWHRWADSHSHPVGRWPS